MLITYIDFEMKTYFTRVHRRSHGDSYPIEIFKLLLYQIIIFESAKHRGVVNMNSLLYSDEFGCESKISLLIVVIELSLTFSSIFAGIGVQI